MRGGSSLIYLCPVFGINCLSHRERESELAGISSEIRDRCDPSEPYLVRKRR
jgi:hypothetical protein